ncbi:hypothetical protein [Mesorhizobium amorphae]|uniref:hypothetical protein n=1 Tax=Mesorhizobium amorphae TaxID=71433 RepID=UPI001182E73D|nr:hypothetical protein [Mesorhizobium amorphae]
MTLEEIEALSATLAQTIKEHVAAAVQPLHERIASLEAREPVKGISVTSAVIDRAGNLVLTMSDGTTKDVGPVIGKDGDPGKDGVDGLAFEDMTEELADDGRTIIRRYSRGEQVKEFRHQVAVVLDRGVYKDGHEYEPGDGVTWGGSFWIAQQKTTEKPEGSDCWRLAVKRGRAGKDAPVASPAAKAPIRVGIPAAEA